MIDGLVSEVSLK